MERDRERDTQRVIETKRKRRSTREERNAKSEREQGGGQGRERESVRNNDERGHCKKGAQEGGTVETYTGEQVRARTVGQRERESMGGK